MFHSNVFISGDVASSNALDAIELNLVRGSRELKDHRITDHARVKINHDKTHQRRQIAIQRMRFITRNMWLHRDHPFVIQGPRFKRNASPSHI